MDANRFLFWHFQFLHRISDNRFSIEPIVKVFLVTVLVSFHPFVHPFPERFANELVLKGLVHETIHLVASTGFGRTDTYKTAVNRVKDMLASNRGTIGVAVEIIAGKWTTACKVEESR